MFEFIWKLNIFASKLSLSIFYLLPKTVTSFDSDNSIECGPTYESSSCN